MTQTPEVMKEKITTFSHIKNLNYLQDIMYPKQSSKTNNTLGKILVTYGADDMLISFTVKLPYFSARKRNPNF